MLITIENFIFQTKHNITALKKSVKVNYDKQNTITKLVYTHIGGYDENLEFEANIILKDFNDFRGFEELVKQAKPLKISAFDLVFFKYILISELTIIAENFFKTSLNGEWYYSKRLQIKGAIVDI